MHKAYGTSTKPWWVTCNDDQDYVVKFLNPNKAFANELICYQIANKIGLTTAPSFVIKIEQDDVDKINDRKKKVGEPLITVGKYFFSKKVYGGYTLNVGTHNSLSSDVIQNLEQVPGMIAFDSFVNNGDRSATNAIIEPAGKSKFMKYVLIDHGHCFTNDTWNKDSFKDLPYIIKKEKIPWKTTEITSISDFCPYISALNSLDESFFKQIIDNIPPEWKQNKEDFDALLDFLKNRDAGKVLEAIIKAKDNTDFFPNLK